MITVASSACENLDNEVGQVFSKTWDQNVIPVGLPP